MRKRRSSLCLEQSKIKSKTKSKSMKMIMSKSKSKIMSQSNAQHDGPNRNPHHARNLLPNHNPDLNLARFGQSHYLAAGSGILSRKRQ